MGTADAQELPTCGRSVAAGDLLQPDGAADGICDTPAVTGVHHRIDAIALLLEAGNDRPFKRAATRQLDAHRVDEAAVHDDFVVDVSAGGFASRADKADHLALVNPLADLTSLGEGR